MTENSLNVVESDAPPLPDGKGEDAPVVRPTSSRSTTGLARRRRRRSGAPATAPMVGPVLVGVYVRVSMAKEEMLSPKLQLRDVKAYLARLTAESGREWRVALYKDDLDISGRSFAREGIQELMTAMREGTITKIVTYSLDRFGRNLEQALTHLKEVEALGGQLLSVREPMEADTAIGSFMRTQTLAMAELQSQQIAEGWKRVHQLRLADGLPTNGRERYGYLAHRMPLQRGDMWRPCPQGCTAEDKCKTRFVPDPETAPVIQRIYQEYIAGQGFQRIAHGLNADAIPTPGQVADRRSSNTKRHERSLTTTWCAGSVIDVADSGFAAGLISHHDQWLQGAHEALITQEVWVAYQERREAQRIVPTKARSPHWALAGIAVCGSCGGPMYCTSSPRGVQYALYCGSARTSRGCRGSYRTRAAVEAAVELWLQGIVRAIKPGSPLRKQAAVIPKPVDPFRTERRSLHAVAGGAEAKGSRLLDAYTDGVLDLAEYKRRKDVLQREVDGALTRLKELDAPPAKAPSPELLVRAGTVWASMRVDEQRALCRDLLKQILVHPNKSVELIPLWHDRVLVTFTHRNSKPAMPPGWSPR